MKFFSEDLSVKAVIQNTLYGFHVLIDEWYWLLSSAFFEHKMKKLNKKYYSTENVYVREELKEKMETLQLSHENFRKMQIENRLS